MKDDGRLSIPLKTTQLLIMTKSMIGSTCAEDMGQFLYHLDPDTRKITGRPEKLQLKIINCFSSSYIYTDYYSGLKLSLI